MTWSRDNTLRLWPVNTSLQTASAGSSIDATSYTGTAEDEDAEETLQSNNNSRIESEAEEDYEGNKKSGGSACQALEKPGESDKVQCAGESRVTSKEHRSFTTEKSRSVGTSIIDSEKTSTSRDSTLPTDPKYKDSAERSSESALRLRAEFDDLNVLEHSRVLKIEDLNETKRVCKVSSTLLVPPDQTMLRIFLRINFPSGYPSTSPPTFVYGKGIVFEGVHCYNSFWGCTFENEPSPRLFTLQARHLTLRPAQQSSSL